jgi:DMSO reductase family type II enzyme heme b subunit
MLSSILTTGLVLLGLGSDALAKGDAANGKAVYDKRCEQCHGADGAADGAAATFMYPRPRVFKENSVYKFAVTPDGAIPTEQDMYTIINEGIPGTSMPGFPILSESEKWDLVALLRSWSEDFSDPESIEEMVPMAELECPPIPSSTESIKRGAQVYKDNMCSDCHGNAGRGDGPNWNKLAEDSWGNTMVPRNLHNPESFRNGYEPADILKSISRGLVGSPMASYRDAITIEDRWHLVNYINSLSTAPKASGDERVLAVQVAKLPTTASDKVWETAPSSRFHLISQVVEPPRLFFPSVEYVNAQAVYSSLGVTLKITWDDRAQSKGTNLTDTYKDRDGTVYRDTDHPDQFALQFPAKADQDGARPYFMLGDAKRGVNTWWWRSDLNKIQEINVKGFGNFQIQKPETTQIKGDVTYKDGRYTMLVSRALKTTDKNDVQFESGGWIPLGFNAWDGNKGEIGQRRSLTTWMWLYLEPEIPAQASVFPPLTFLFTLGLLGFVVHTTRESYLVETGEQDAPRGLMPEGPPKGTLKAGVFIGVLAVVILGPLVASMTDGAQDDAVHAQIAQHQTVTSATSGFDKSADAETIRAKLVKKGVPSALAKPRTLHGMELIGGMKAPGERVGAAFRYRHGKDLYSMQHFTQLDGGGATKHVRHAGHIILRGYEAPSGAAVVWNDGGTIVVFTGPGTVEHMLDMTQTAVFDSTPGGGHH